MQHQCVDSHQRTSALLGRTCGQNGPLGDLREGLEMSELAQAETGQESGVEIEGKKNSERDAGREGKAREERESGQGQGRMGWKGMGGMKAREAERAGVIFVGGREREG